MASTDGTPLLLQKNMTGYSGKYGKKKQYPPILTFVLPMIPYLEAQGWKCEHAREGKTGDERRSEEGNRCKKVYKFDSIYTTDILNVLKSWGEGE